jgi:obg-like ATPase 1
VKSHQTQGIVGLPNIGKSTLFNILTSSTVPAENYPFCTIDPSESRVAVPDSRFDWLVSHYNPKNVVPAVLTCIDIAGLVKGAANGKAFCFWVVTGWEMLMSRCSRE